MRSEYSAMQGLSDSKEEIIQGCIADRNAATRLNEQLEKQRKNAEFWHKVRVFFFRIVCAVIAIHTLIHFSR